MRLFIPFDTYVCTYLCLDLKQHFELCVTKRLIVYVVTMPVFQCPIEGCAFQTDDVDTAVAAVLLTIHNNVHLSTPVASNAGSHHRAPKLERPKISSGSSEETWNTFSTRWSMFKRTWHQPPPSLRGGGLKIFVKISKGGPGKFSKFRGG